MKRPCPFAAAERKRGAAELVANWNDEQLVTLGASSRLVSSWGLTAPDAQQLVDAERRRRRL